MTIYFVDLQLLQGKKNYVRLHFSPVQSFSWLIDLFNYHINLFSQWAYKLTKRCISVLKNEKQWPRLRTRSDPSNMQVIVAHWLGWSWWTRSSTLASVGCLSKLFGMTLSFTCRFGCSVLCPFWLLSIIQSKCFSLSGTKSGLGRWHWRSELYGYCATVDWWLRVGSL